MSVTFRATDLSARHWIIESYIGGVESRKRSRRRIFPCFLSAPQ